MTFSRLESETTPSHSSLTEDGNPPAAAIEHRFLDQRQFATSGDKWWPLDPCPDLFLILFEQFRFSHWIGRFILRPLDQDLTCIRGRLIQYLQDISRLQIGMDNTTLMSRAQSQRNLTDDLDGSPGFSG